MPIRVEQTEESRIGWSGPGNYKWNHDNGTPKPDPATPFCACRLEPESRKLTNIRASLLLCYVTGGVGGGLSYLRGGSWSLRDCCVALR